jgi:uncharacterized protein (TIGR03067 family)
MFAFLTAITFALAPVPEDASEKALKALQGKWRIVATEDRGGKPEKDDSKEFLTFTADALIWQRYSTVDKWKVKIDPSNTPAHIDFTAKIGEKLWTVHAVYEIKGGRLAICFGNNATPDNAADRPGELKTGQPEQRPKKGKLMLFFERVKE